MEADNDVVEEAQDPFGSIIKFCIPTPSQEAKFQICPLARESENFADPNPDTLSSSSSPDPTPSSDPTPILMLSLPDSLNSVEHDPVFHTPPEHHLHHSSSEDQIPFPESVRLGEGGGVGVYEDEETVPGDDTVPAEETVRAEETVPADQTVSADETEAVFMEIDGYESVNGDEVIVLDSEDSDGEGNGAADLGEDGDGVDRIDAVRRFGEGRGVCESGESVRDSGVPVVDDVCGKDDRLVENGDGRICGSEESDGSLGSREIEEDVGKLKRVAVNGHVGGTREKSGGDGFCEVGLKENRSGCDDRGRGSGEDDRVEGGDGGVAGRKRQLPPSVKGKEKNVESSGDGRDPVESKGGLMDILDHLKGVFGNGDGGCGDEDFLEIAKSRGLTFLRPRWWDPESDEER